jgi:predicted permease
VSPQQAANDLVTISKSYRERYPARLDANNTSEPQRFVDFLVSGLQPTFYTLLGAVTFVLLIACANVSSLFLGRLAARDKEVAVRQSLGATRGRVIRQFLIESVLFSAIAGALGAVLATWALWAIQSLIASQLPPNAVLTLNWRALAFTGAATLASALLVGLAPAVQSSRSDIVDALKDSARGSTGAGGTRFRATLIVLEVALSVILLVGSSLLLISFLKLQRTPPGFDSQGVAGAFVNVPVARYKTNAQQAAFFNDVIDRLRAHPQVTDAAAALGLPLTGFSPRSPYSVSGRTVLPLPQRPIAGLSVVSESYFRLMHISLAAGRAFTPDDRENTPDVGIINESFARKLFPGESAIGKVLLRGRDAEVRTEIVGVIHDVKSTGLNTPAPDEIYLAMRQLARPAMTVVAKTNGDPTALQAVLRTAVAEVDPDRAISFFATMDSNVEQSLGVQRIIASLTVAFAALALVLSAVGLYSVLAYAVGQRRTEIGIRMALGAQTTQVLGLVMRSGLRLVAVGLVIGLVGAGLIARLIQTLLYDVQPLDPVVYAVVTLLFAVVATLACLLPSFRAARIDPLIALRAG